MCIDIVEILFGIAHWQISSIFDRDALQFENARVFSLHVFIYWLKFLKSISPEPLTGSSLYLC